MGSFSNFLEDAFLNHLLNTAFTPAATIYVALCTADPTDAGTGASMSEVANANGYARTAITFGAAATRKVIQSGAVTFPQATGSWGTITSWALTSANTYGTGNVYAYGNFASSFAPVAGNTPTIPSGEIQVQFANSTYTATTISAASGDNSINDSANAFPLYPAGAIIHISGFTGGAPSGLATVVSSTVSKIVVSGLTLTTDAAGESVTVALSGGFTNYFIHGFLDRAFRNQAFAKPATYVGLSTTTIADTTVSIAGLTEVSGGAYARVQVNINGGSTPTWTTVSGGAADNLHAITFPTPSASWGLVTSCFLVDSASGAGNVCAYDNASIVDQTPLSGDTVQFAIGSFDLAVF